MSFYRTGSSVPINVVMVNGSGIPITGLGFSNFAVTLLVSGITQSIAGHFTIAEQQSGIYRIVLDSTVVTTPDVDYVLIVQDLTGQALMDRVEFSLLNNSIDSAVTILDADIKINTNLLNVINSNTSGLQSSLNDPTNGLAAIKSMENTLNTQIQTSQAAVQSTVTAGNIPINNSLSTITTGQSTYYTSLSNQIGTVSSKADSIISYVNNLNPLLTNATYGLAALKAELDTILADVLTTAGTTQAQMSSSFTTTDASIAAVAASLAIAIADILNNTNLLNVVISDVQNLNPLLTNATYGLSALKSELDIIIADSTVNTNSINSTVLTQTGITSGKVDALSTATAADYANLTNQINLIPTNPLTTSNPLALNLSKLDTTVSSIAFSSAAAAWSYPSRSLTGASGINQIDVSGLDASFLVGHPAYINVAMMDTSGNIITGRTYPGTLGVGLWKGGVSVTPTGVTIQETAPAVYRTTIPGTLIDTPSIDYLLIVSDNSNVGVTQRVEFSAFQAAGVVGPRTVVVDVVDSFTALPIPDTQVYVKNMNQTLIINKGTTDSLGSYTTSLTDGSYNVFVKKSFVDFGVQPIVVNVLGDTTAVIRGGSFIPATPTSPTTSTLYGWLSDMGGIPVRNAKVTITDPLNFSYSGAYKIGKTTKQIITDNNGYWSIMLVRSSQLNPPGVPYLVLQEYPGFSFKANVLIPDTSNVEFSTVAVPVS